MNKSNLLLLFLCAGALFFALRRHHAPTEPIVVATTPAPEAPASPTPNLSVQSNEPKAEPVSAAPTADFKIDILEFLRSDLLHENVGNVHGRFYRMQDAFFRKGSEDYLVWVTTALKNPDFRAFTFDPQYVYLRYEVSNRSARSGWVRRLEGVAAPPHSAQGEALPAKEGYGRTAAPRILREADAGKTFLSFYVADQFDIGGEHAQLTKRATNAPSTELSIAWYEFVKGRFQDTETGIVFPYVLRMYVQNSACFVQRLDFAYHFGIYDVRMLQNLSSKYCIMRLHNTHEKSMPPDTYRSVWGEVVHVTHTSPPTSFEISDAGGHKFELVSMPNRWLADATPHRWMVSDSNHAPEANPPYPEYFEPRFHVYSAGADIRALPYRDTHLRPEEKAYLLEYFKSCSTGVTKSSPESLLETFLRTGGSLTKICTQKARL